MSQLNYFFLRLFLLSFLLVKITPDPSFSMNFITIPVIFVPRCGGAWQTNDDFTYGTAHEIAEAITDPYPGNSYYQIDAVHKVYNEISNANSENADLCEHFASPLTFRDTVYNYFIPRLWSNASLLAGHTPCISGQANVSFHTAIPVLGEMVNFGNSTNEGVQIPVGSSRTIEIQLYSDQAVADWTVSATEVKGSGNLSFSQNITTGNNGTVILLTITVIKKNTTYNAEIFKIASTGVTTTAGSMDYYVVVGN